MKGLFYSSIALVLIVLTVSYSAYPTELLAAEVAVDTTTFVTLNNEYPGSPAAVWTDDNNGYVFYLGAEGDVEMASTTDGGATWAVRNAIDSVNTTDAVGVAVWWDGWTPGTTSTRYIHIATTDTGVDDTYYTRLDTQTGALSTTVLGTTQAAACTRGVDCMPTITMAENGVLYMGTAEIADRWIVSCSTTCTTAGNWTERTGLTITLGDDFYQLLPVPGTNNVMLVAWDFSLNDIFTYQYSATSSSWQATTTLSTANEINSVYDAQLFGTAISTTTGFIYLVATDDTNDYTVADHDIDFWRFSSTTGWVNVVATTTTAGGITGAKIAVDSSSSTAPVLYTIYSRRTTLTNASTTNIYYITSSDNGDTWSAEQGPINDNADHIEALTVNILSNQKIGAWWQYDTAPRDDDEYYDLVADLTPWTPPAGGGDVEDVQDVFWFGTLVPILWRRSKMTI